jgi:hypothetical protein
MGDALKVGHFIGEKRPRNGPDCVIEAFGFPLPPSGDHLPPIVQHKYPRSVIAVLVRPMHTDALDLGPKTAP